MKEYGIMVKKGWKVITIRQKEYDTLMEIKYSTESMADVVERILEKPWTWERFIEALVSYKEYSTDEKKAHGKK
jgi:predicted CopG family antitoxin